MTKKNGWGRMTKKYHSFGFPGIYMFISHYWSIYCTRYYHSICIPPYHSQVLPLHSPWFSPLLRSPGFQAASHFQILRLPEPKTSSTKKQDGPSSYIFASPLKKRQRVLGKLYSFCFDDFYRPFTYLVGGWTTPLKNMSSSIGMMIIPTISGKIKNGNQTTNQL